MCPACERVWSVLHVLWSSIYVSCGAAQLVAGIFFLISIPSLHLSCNLWAGTWNIFIGIGSGMLACFGRVSPRRQEMLLYMSVSILIVNAVNGVLGEWGYYVADMPNLLSTHQYHALINYACLATRVSAATVIVIAFVDTQFAFCSMQTLPKEGKKKSRGSHEQVSDIEYIIPRRKSSKPNTVYSAYSQSWVYDADTAGTAANHTETSQYLQLPQELTPKAEREHRESGLENGIVHDTAHLIDNPVVHIEEASDDSNSNSDRKLCYMKSFSRSASPIIMSASSSQMSLNNPPIYECLQKLTEPEIYRSRLNSALSSRSDDCSHYQAPQPVVRPISPNIEKVQYASLMKELEKAIVGKKEPSPTSPHSNSESATASEKTRTNSTKSSHESSRSDAKNSDAEFSKELEAALQLIQDLESPNTVETPSEPKIFGERESRPLTVWRNSDASESEKTLSAVGSLAEITSPLNECQPELSTFKPLLNGKGACVVVQYSESQSTSGYSSPTHKSNNHMPNWSTVSSVNSSNHDLGKPLSYTIRNTKSTAVISLYEDSPKTKNVTLVNITGNTDPVVCEPIHSSTFLVANDSERESPTERRASIGSTNVWNVKSMLRKKKNVPKLCPELEGAIIKSESLAYLSELELLARHQRNKDIQRRIEQRVLQQLGTPRTESEC